MKTQHIKLYLLLILVTFGCEEPTTIETDQTPSQLIIEGLITNELKRHNIKVTQTADFYQSGETPRISDAVVTVTDNSNNVIIFNEVSNGNYQPDQPFEGLIGVVYDLSVIVDGQTYTASEELLPVTTIDSLTFALNEDETEETTQDIFSVFLFTLEPQDEENYYLFKFYRNGIWLNGDGDDITVTDDTAVGEAIDGIEAPYFYLKGDTARTEMYSLTRESFVFWSDVASLLESDGGVFTPLPANPRSNITGGALGVFQVSAVDGKDLIIP